MIASGRVPWTAGVLRHLITRTLPLAGILLTAAASSALSAVSPLDPSKGSISSVATVSGSVALQLFENFDADGDSMADNRLYLWTSARGTLKAAINHNLALYNRQASSVRFEGPGAWGTMPVYVSITLAPYSSLYPGYYKMTVVGYKADAFGNPLKDIYGRPIVAYPSTILYPRATVTFP